MCVCVCLGVWVCGCVGVWVGVGGGGCVWWVGGCVVCVQVSVCVSLYLNIDRACTSTMNN